MTLTPLTHEDYEKTASALMEYWKGRGMTYDRIWALSYLREGHGRDVVSDTFYLYREQDHIAGLVALVRYHGNVAEIRDETLFSFA